MEKIIYFAQEVSKSGSSKLSNDLNNKFEALFPAWPTIVATLLSLSIIFFVLTKYLYKPVKKMHDDRKDFIQKNIDSSIEQKSIAFVDRTKANEELIEAKIEANKIINNARSEANLIINDGIEKSKVESINILNNANKLIKARKEKFKKESKQEIVDVALNAAHKIIEKQMNLKTSKTIIEEFLKENK